MYLILLLLMPLSGFNANAQPSNPNLFVSAENSLFDNHFSGSMVVEVIVRDSDIGSLDNHHGEPDVTLNGKKLRMAQASDGNWYAFFANKDKAMQADQVASTGSAGQSLDFGAFCDRNTDANVLGASFSETEGVAIPRAIAGSTHGTSSFTACTGSFASLPNQNNVVRRPPSLNTNPSVPDGQIGINSNAWPVIQLFSFHDNVSILYNKAGGTQRVDLYYFPEQDIPNISLKLDREGYPKGAEVFVTINDIQLNQDPTSVDSWTFNVNSSRATFYQAFTETGSNSGNGGSGLVDLNPHLASLGFKNNGNVGMDLGSVVELRTNQRQPSNFVSTGLVTYNKIVTLVETAPNSGVFVSSDFNNKSTIGILSNAPRFQSGSIEYNSHSISIVSATYTAKLSLGSQGGQFNPGQKVMINLADPEQNLNPGGRDDLDVFRSSATIPTLRIGNPVTLQQASVVKFCETSTTSVTACGITSVSSSVPDKNSDRLIVDTRSVSTAVSFEKITLNLGITAHSLQDLFIDTTNPNDIGTNWINYDLRSFQNQLGISSFSDTNMTLHFGGLPGTTKIRILNAGDISAAKGLVQVTNSMVTAIKSVPSSSSVFLEISFDASADTTNAGLISNEQDTQPIVLDFFSFGNRNGVRVNNAIYRAELQETSNNSGIFAGTLEYTIINQLNQNDPNLIKSLRTISNEIKFLSNDQLVDEKGVNLAYSDIQVSGAQVNVSTKTDVKTHSGTVTLESQTYRLGQPVVVILNDPDLNTDNDSIQSYTVV
ncbi:MAG: peptidase, partial [Thaumarchaeota archaeon]|nr:peptidase [Nitrososphaerota archaeon]